MWTFQPYDKQWTGKSPLQTQWTWRQLKLQRSSSALVSVQPLLEHESHTVPLNGCEKGGWAWRMNNKQLYKTSDKKQKKTRKVQQPVTWPGGLRVWQINRQMEKLDHSLFCNSTVVFSWWKDRILLINVKLSQIWDNFYEPNAKLLDSHCQHKLFYYLDSLGCALTTTGIIRSDQDVSKLTLHLFFTSFTSSVLHHFASRPLFW